MATQEFTPSIERLEFAIKYLEDEHETWLALAITLQNLLTPRDPQNPEDDEDVITWRLSQVLTSLITSAGVMQTFKTLALAPKSP